MSAGKEQKGLPRAVEIILAALGLLLTSPLILASSIVIRSTSRGGAIFRQVRVGRDGKAFILFKLRTMSSSPGALVTAANDSRVTAVGRILRRYKIDELPQLWNVLRGDMGIVGPRPEVPALVYDGHVHWKEVLRCRPGLTDPVAVRLRNEELLLASHAEEESFYQDVIQPYKLIGYLDYLRDRTPAKDVQVIIQTLAAVLNVGTHAPPTKAEMLQAVADRKLESSLRAERPLARVPVLDESPQPY